MPLGLPLDRDRVYDKSDLSSWDMHMNTKRRKLGSQDIHPIGLGCMNLHHGYGAPVAPEVATQILNQALDQGCNFLDTATLYGLGRNESCIGDNLSTRRDEYVLASKCVLDFEGDERLLDGSPARIKTACENSLRRLKTDVIDLYYMHRPDPKVPIEDSIGALAELVDEGKIRMIGLSEMDAATLRKAHSVHPITAMQSEYSLMTRNPEIAVLDTCAELGVTFVAFSPVGRGVISDVTLDPTTYYKRDMRNLFARFQEPNLSANYALLAHAKDEAKALGCTLAQLSIAWTLAQGEHVVAIPGTTNSEHLSDNLRAGDVDIPAEVLARLDKVFKPEAIAGMRYPAPFQATVTTEQYGFETANE
jgi:aryl-alcohol dehydrogenase-like predicted oxidoreductase